MRRLVLLAVLLTLGSLHSAPPARAEDEEPKKAEWTILVYHDADCDLEAPMLDDLDEMLAVGSSDEVKIVALVDRSPAAEPEGRYTNREVGGLKDWSGGKYLEVQKGALKELGTLEGEPNLGDASTLHAFLEQGMKDFPAKRYALIFSDHGLSWPGVCSDDSHDGDCLDLREIRSVLEKLPKSIGKLDLLGFDACLMATVEVAKAMAPFAKVLVASEELEPGTGWWYTPVLEALQKAPTTDAATLGGWIADRYQESFAQEQGADRAAGRTITLSVVDLTKAEAVAAAAAALGEAGAKVLAEKKRAGWVPMAKARAHAEEYGRSADPAKPGSDMFDLGDLADSLAASSPALAAAAGKAKAALAAAVLHAVRGDTRPASQGLAVYFPREGGPLRTPYEVITANALPAWIALLDAFGAFAASDTDIPAASDAATTAPGVEADKPVTVSTTVASLEDLESASFVLVAKHGDAMLVVGAIPDEPDDEGKLTSTWDGRWFTLEDGKQKLLCPITSVDEVDDAADTFLAEVPAQIQAKGKGDWEDVTLTFFLDEDEGGLKGTFLTATAFDEGGPRDVPLEAGDRVRAVYLRVEANGDVVPVTADGEGSVLVVDDEDNLKVGYDRVPAGDWLVGFWLEDLAGNSSLELVAVTVK
jgi:clostripain